MIDDMQIMEAVQRAERIKAVMPHLTVSTDALFNAIVLGKRRLGRPTLLPKYIAPVEPAEWFDDALRLLKGRRLTIGKFMVLSGRLPVTRLEARTVGRWLRASGRQPKKCGGDQVFDI